MPGVPQFALWWGATTHVSGSAGGKSESQSSADAHLPSPVEPAASWCHGWGLGAQGTRGTGRPHLPI